MKKATHLLFFLTMGIALYAQDGTYMSIPKEFIRYDQAEADERAGSCASPDGPILTPVLGAYPTYSYLYNNGYCYSFSPPIKNATYCWTFTSPGTTVTLDAGFSYTATGGFSLWFDNFALYTCAPACATVYPPGMTLTYTGLTAGQCYTWCFNTHMTGGGASGGFTTLCPYIIYTAPLPIELSSFYAVPENETVQLNWSTETELNCSTFDVMRSSDGVGFEKIGTVQGNGTSNISHAYTFIDNAPLNSTNYYQLWEYDFDGDYGVSQVISCTYGETVVNINYYDLTGHLINIDEAAGGMYIKESLTSTSRQIRELFYKNR